MLAKTTDRGDFAFMTLPEELYQCQTPNCGYIYSPDRGDRQAEVPAGTRFENLPKDWRCPCCGASRKMFRPLTGPKSAATKSRNEDARQG